MRNGRAQESGELVVYCAGSIIYIYIPCYTIYLNQDRSDNISNHIRSFVKLDYVYKFDVPMPQCRTGGQCSVVYAPVHAGNLSRCSLNISRKIMPSV